MRILPKVVPQYKELAKARIIETAMLVFAEKGYHETTIEDVAHRMGVSESGVYLYFKTKRDLFKAISEAVAELHQQQAAQITPSVIRTEDPVKGFFDLATNVIDQHESVFALLFEMLAEATRDAFLMKILSQDFHKDHDVVDQFLMELRKRAMIGAGADLESISMGILTLVYGYGITRLLGVSRDEAKRTCTEAMKSMLNGTLIKSSKASK